jgi:hypothetical protein
MRSQPWAEASVWIVLILAVASCTVLTDGKPERCVSPSPLQAAE